MSGDRLRSPEDIGATGAAWVTELELAALVEIAKAARDVIEAADAARPRYELPLCADALRSALARLDSGEGK